MSLQPVTSEPQTQLSDHYTTTPLPQVARLGCSDTDSRPQKTRHKRFLKRRCVWRRTESSCLGQDSTGHVQRHDTFNLYHVSTSFSLSFPLSHSASFLSVLFLSRSLARSFARLYWHDKCNILPCQSAQEQHINYQRIITITVRWRILFNYSNKFSQ